MVAHHPGSFPPTPFPPFFHCFNGVTGVCSSYCSWLGCQDLSAMGAFFAANSRISWRSGAPKLHFSDAVVNFVF